MEEKRIAVERVHLSTSLTSVKWINPQYILTGMGGEVCLLHSCAEDIWKRAHKEEVFSYQSVHGLVSFSNSSRRVLAFGGRQYALLQLTLSESQSSIKVLWRCQSEDWVLDGCWLDNDRLALLTAHGKLVELNSESGQPTRSAVCLDRSILYSARIISQPDWNDIILLGGTVHNQIIVWTSFDSDCVGRTIATLSGHKGVIFSARYDENTRRICSTSDDRTARIWQVVLGDDEGCSEVERWCRGEFSLTLTLFGHKARVWDSVFLPHSLLATIAEDGGMMVWSESGECLMQSWVQAGLLCLDLLQPVNSTKEVTSELSSADSLTLTAGGSDGSLYLFPVCLPQPSLVSLSQLEDVPRQVCLSSEGAVISYTENGHILINCNSEGWIKCFSSESLSSYCVMSMSPCRLHLAAADIFGSVYLLSVKGREMDLQFSEKIFDGRVFSLHWVSGDKLLACGPKGRLHLLNTSLSASDSGFSASGRYELPECKERWTTCAILINHSYLVCGDRLGSLHLYSISSNQEKPVCSLTRVHGTRGVSCIQHVCNSSSDEVLIVSCGRDGTLRKYKLCIDDTNSPTLESLLCLRLSMDWASHIIFSSVFGQLIIGFHNVYFCVWSLKEQRYLLKLKCWGGHRSWDLYLDKEGNLQVVFIKDKFIHSLTTSLRNLALPTPLMGLHSKTVNACGWLQDWGLYVTGSEDTSVRVCSDFKSDLTPVCCVESHVSSVRALGLLRLPFSSLKTLIVTAGGRAQLKLWTLSPSGELCERGSHMMRREEDLLRDWRNEKALDEPEVRYMDLSLLQNSPNNAFIYTVASDGIIRLFEVDLVEMSLNLVQSEKRQEGRCFLRVATLSSTQGYILCVTGSTDGYTTFWQHSLSSGELKAMDRFKVHSGGVNALSAVLLEDKAESGKALVATGGDDSCVVMSLYTITANFNIKLVSSLRLDTLHTCQVTGLNLVDEYIVSVGLDGRLNLIQWSLKNGHLESCHLMTRVSSLSDIHGLVAHLKQKELSVCLHGIGLEVVKILLPPVYRRD